MSIWTKHAMWAILKHNDDQLVKALNKLFDYQTKYEKVSKWTHHNNSVGFNKPDSKRMSVYAIRSKYRKLTPKELAWIRPKMYKYTGQLCRIANGQQSMVTK
mgnify:CR=1 FL=1